MPPTLLEGEPVVELLTQRPTKDLVDRLQTLRESERAIIAELRRRALGVLADMLGVSTEALASHMSGPEFEPGRRRLTLLIHSLPLEEMDADYIASLLSGRPPVLFAIKECTPGAVLRIGVDPSKLKIMT